MKNEKLSLNKILTIILVFIAALFIVSTILVFAEKKTSFQKRTQANNFEGAFNSSSENLSSFTGIARIRCSTKSEENHPNGVPLVITPYFSYQKDDVEFFEELSRKTPEIRKIIEEYFSSRTYTELKNTDEDKIKSDLLEKINENLFLNKIRQIYFSEYIFLE